MARATAPAGGLPRVHRHVGAPVRAQTHAPSSGFLGTVRRRPRILSDDPPQRPPSDTPAFSGPQGHPIEATRPIRRKPSRPTGSRPQTHDLACPQVGDEFVKLDDHVSDLRANLSLPVRTAGNRRRWRSGRFRRQSMSEHFGTPTTLRMWTSRRQPKLRLLPASARPPASALASSSRSSWRARVAAPEERDD